MPDEVAIAKEKVELLDSSAIIHEQAFCCSSSFYTPTTSMIVNWRLSIVVLVLASTTKIKSVV